MVEVVCAKAIPLATSKAPEKIVAGIQFLMHSSKSNRYKPLGGDPDRPLAYVVRFRPVPARRDGSVTYGPKANRSERTGHFFERAAKKLSENIVPTDPGPMLRVRAPLMNVDGTL